MHPLPPQLGDLSVGFALILQRGMQAAGVSPAAASGLLQHFGLTAQLLASAGARLSIPRYMRLGHAAIELCSRPDLGLLAGAQSRLELLGLAGVCAALAPDVRAAVRCLTDFELLYARNYLGQSRLEEDSRGAWVSFYSIAPYNGYNRFVVDAVLRGWLAQLQQLSGQPVLPERVQIEYPPPPHAARFEPAFGCPVEFSAPANRLRLSHATLALPNPQHCAHSWQELLHLCQQQLQPLQTPLRLSQQTAQLIASRLRQGEPDLCSIARLLKLPAWTLQRRLEQEGTCFRQLLQDTRHALALSYLRDTHLSLGEIAWSLGFASSEAFQRAFKRWQGQPPGLYRRLAGRNEPEC